MQDFHDLYVRYASDVHRFVVYLGGDAALADDITSETFLRAWTSASPIREGTVKAYLFTIARHLVFAESRRASKLDELGDSVPSTAPGPGDRAEQRATVRRVMGAIGGLPDVDRAALLLRVRDGLSYEEIAAALDLSLSNVKVKIHRARLKLAALA
jgi:RNA polymerase sigma-70 factor (ECF subfamily)